MNANPKREREFQMSVYWSATVQNPHDSSAPATGTMGDAPDRDAAISAAIAAARELTRRPDGSVWSGARIAIHPSGLNREIDVHVVGWNEAGIDDAVMRSRIEDALVERARRLADSDTRMWQYAAEKARRGPVWHRTLPGSVTTQWTRILDTLRRNGIDTSVVTGGGASATAITAAAAATGVEWPAELLELYGLVDGESDRSPLFPSERLLPVPELVESHSMMVGIWREVAADMGFDPPAAAVAGEIAGTFRPEFLPFAGLDGYWLVVDTRPGELHGCVTYFDKVEADSGGPQWRSISAMLTDLADSLETGGRFGRWWVPAVVDGSLTWEFQQ